MSFFHFLKFVMNLFKGIVSILLVGVALNNVVLSKFPQQMRFMRFYNMNSGPVFIKGQALGKLTGCERNLAINLSGCFCLLFLLSFIRKTKNGRLKNPTGLLYENLMKPLMNCYILTVCNCLYSASHHVPCIDIYIFIP